MKMLSTLFLVFLCLNLSVFAQENVLPNSGNVGIGTFSPSARLTVNGRAVIDSALVVRDSINVEKDLIVNQDVRIDGKLTINQNSVAKNNFKIKGDLILPNLENDSLSHRIVSIDENNRATSIDFNDFAARVIDFGYEPYPDPLTYCELPFYLEAPKWIHGSHKIYSECPEVNIGIATAEPRVSLDVRGTTYSNKLALGHSDPNNPNGYFDLRAPVTNFNADENIFNVRNTNTNLLTVTNSGITTAYKFRAAGIFVDMVNLPSGENPLLIQWDDNKLLQLDPSGLLRTRAVKVIWNNGQTTFLTKITD